jgi:hypothetical protein
MFRRREKSLALAGIRTPPFPTCSLVTIPHATILLIKMFGADFKNSSQLMNHCEIYGSHSGIVEDAGHVARVGEKRNAYKAFDR